MLTYIAIDIHLTWFLTLDVFLQRHFFGYFFIQQSIKFKSGLDREITCLNIDQAGVRIHDLWIMNSTCCANETLIVTTEPSGTSK